MKKTQNRNPQIFTHFAANSAKVVLLVLCTFSCFISSAQDKIICKDGTTIMAKILTMDDPYIRYKRFGNLAGPDYFIYKTQVERLEYKKKETPTAGQTNQVSVKNNELQPPKLSTLTNRHALVIGNDRYIYSTKLNGQPYNDAQDVATRLKNMGFQVSTATDANRQQMLDELDDFVLKAKGADVVMLYYSGHGVQDSYENYLVPIDARFVTKSDIANRGIGVNGIIGKLGSAKAKFSVIAMDACRSQAVTIETSDTKDEVPKGFIPIKSEKLIESVYISLVSRAGQPAFVNTNGRNGYFTEALLKHLQNGKRIESIFRAVSAEVERMTNQQQQPEIIDRLKGDLEF